MTNPIDAPLTDPETLRDRAGVDVTDATHEVDAEDVADAADLDSHVVVGVTGEHGVLLRDDGHHGWTLPAFPVADGDDWLAVAREEFAALAGADVEVTGFERVRRVEYRAADGSDAAAIWNVVVSATPAESLPADPESRVDGTELAWFDEPPGDASDAVEADVRLFVE